MSRRWIDILNLFGIWIFISFLSGSQAWTSLDTPDSEFHASMAIFGSEVTDRAATPVYFWTRLGYIAPAHAFTRFFGPITGLEVFRLFLLFVIIASIYFTIRVFTTRLNACLLTLFIALNTALLGYLGNPYPTAVVMAGLFALIALLITGNSIWREVSAGAIIGWLVMTNPYGAVFGAVLFLCILLVKPFSENHWKFILRRFVLGVLGFLVAFTLLLASARLLFPTLDWWETFSYYNSALNQADYIFDLYRWTWDPSLLVIFMAAIISWIIFAQNRDSLQARFSVAIATAVPVFALIYWKFSPNPFLEFPKYQAMLWPTALIAMGLAATCRLPQIDLSWSRVFTGISAVALVLFSGHSLLVLDLWQSRMLAVLAIVMFMIGRRRWTIILIAIAISFSMAQLLQNSRDSYGVSSQYLYGNAFRENDVRLKLDSAINGQNFVLSKTKAGDRALTWVDAEWFPGEESLLPLAAFQLWGPNEAERGPLVTTETMKRWNDIRPLSIIMYGKTTEAILDFWNSIPKQNLPTVPECKDVVWVEPDTAHVCVTKLTW